MKTQSVVTCFIEHQGKILILKRSDKVKTYKGKWAAVSGYLESGTDNPEQRAIKEVGEETGLKIEDVEHIYKGTPMEIIDSEINIKWLVHSYLLKIKSLDKIKIDWEHSDIRWIEPEELLNYKTVPKLTETFQQINKHDRK